jgi:hypothetical protein
MGGCKHGRLCPLSKEEGVEFQSKGQRAHRISRKQRKKCLKLEVPKMAKVENMSFLPPQL